MINYTLETHKDFVARGIINPYSRRQKHLAALHICPAKKDGYCDCGCGEKLTGRQQRWATKDCSAKVYRLYNILQSNAKEIKHILREQDGACCKNCGIMENERVQDELVQLQVDHIHPIHKGGGGMGLWNFQLLCVSCHKEKTKQDIKK